MHIYQYPLKVSKDVMEQIKKIAEQEGRSVNKQIEYILRLYIQNFGKSHS